MVLAEQLEDARKFRLAFVVPYARLIEALIALIRARFDRVSELVDEIETAGRAAGDDFLAAIATSVRTRSLVAQGRFREAIAQSMRTVGEVTPSTYGEVIGSRAIALACNLEDARALNYGRACATDDKRDRSTRLQRGCPRDRRIKPGGGQCLRARASSARICHR